MKIEKAPNGLSCVFIENNASDVVSLQLWIKCGSIYESEGEYGVSHFIEHLLFKGTRKHAVGEVASVIESLGGDLNAFTSKEYTCYYVTLPSVHFEKALDTLKELVFFPAFDASEIEAEREVILEEIRRYQDIPGSIASDNYFELHFEGHPYSRPILGYEDVIKNIKRDDIIKYYNRFYTASNSLLSVCGNIKRDDAFKISNKLFSELLDTKVTLPVVTEAKLKDVQSAKNVEMDIKESIFELGFPVPGLLNKDIPALDVLSIILGQGESSRLFKGLRLDKGIVTSISSFSYTPVYGGTFSVVFGFESESKNFIKKLENIFEAVNVEINEIRKGDFVDSEIDKAKNILLSEKVYERETVDGYARKVGHLICTTGSFDFENEYFKRLSAVTRADIINVLNKYLNIKNATLSSVVPKGDGHDSSEFLNILNNTISGPAKIKKTASKKDAVSRPSIDSCFEFDKKFVVGKPKIINHKSGAKIILRKLTSTPLVSMKMFVKGGVLIENEKNHGICNLLARTIMFGAGEHSFEDIANTVDSTASTLHAFSGRNSIGVTLECIKPFFPEILDLTGKIILDAKFEKDYFDNEKKTIQDEIKATQDNLSKYAGILFIKTLYQKHAYRLEVPGTIDSLNAISREDVVALYEKIFAPDNMVISVVGDFDEKLVVEWTDKILNALEARVFKMPSIGKEPEQKNARITKFTKETKQAHIFLGYKTCEISSKDMYVIKVLSSVLSGQSGRLFMNLRDKQSLAYTVMPIEMFGPEPGYFAVYIATENSKIEKAIKEIRRELAVLKKTKISEEELSRAKNFIMGRHAISFQSYGEQTAMMALDELLGIGYDSVFDYLKNIMSVTSDDIINVANKYFIDEKENIAVVSKG
jgi:zinc protease